MSDEAAAAEELMSFPELTAFADELGDAVYLLDEHGRILYCNKAVTAAFAWPVSSLLGRELEDVELFDLQFRTHLLSWLEEDPVWEHDELRLLPDGSTRTVNARWKKLQQPISSATILGIERDITEYVVREQELQQARKLAKIGVLSEGIAHELRNPLSYALSAAQLLSDSRITDDVRSKCIQTITTGLRKAGLIVENLLSLGKPNTQFARSTVLLSEVLNEALDAASSHASYRFVSINQQLQDPDLSVWGNHDMLVQVFHNVVTNALNEMPEGGRISITGERRSDGVFLYVSDSGPGVSDEQLRHLFDPFFTASTSGRGTGLGLTLSYYIMKEHHGTIEVTSRPGKGATFVLAFPLPETQTEPLQD